MKNVLVFATAFASLVGIAGCHHDRKPAEGPAERTGKKLDNAAEDTKDATKEAAEDTKDGAKKAKKDVKRKTD